MMSIIRKFLIVGILFASFVCPAVTQELEPRAYSISPVGTNFLALAYSHSRGGVLFDPSLPVEDVTAEINTTSIVYARVFDMFGRTGQLGMALPYTWGHLSGFYLEEYTSIRRSGLPDPSFRFAVNLKGGPALDIREFSKYRQSTNLGFSLLVSAPLGQYDSSKLINLGGNRWSFRPEFGLSKASGKWVFDLYGGVRFFTSNDNFADGQVRKQHPIGSIQGHVIYVVRPRLWLAFNANFYAGGRTTINGEERQDLQRNSRFGFTASFPLAAKHSLKVAFSRGATTNIGADFTNFGVSYQYHWFSK